MSNIHPCDHCGTPFDLENGGELQVSTLPGLGDLEFSRCPDCIKLDEHLMGSDEND